MADKLAAALHEGQPYPYVDVTPTGETYTVLRHSDGSAQAHAARTKPGSPEDIERRFARYSPRPGALQHVEKVREQAISLAKFVALSNPNPRMNALFLTNLEQAVFWANKAITSNNEVSD